MIEESGESDIEWEDDPSSQSATAPSQSSLLQDSLVEEEQEMSQPLVVNTAPVQDVSPNRISGERGDSDGREVSQGRMWV